jgi:hypothetical protein
MLLPFLSGRRKIACAIISRHRYMSQRFAQSVCGFAIRPSNGLQPCRHAAQRLLVVDRTKRQSVRSLHALNDAARNGRLIGINYRTRHGICVQRSSRLIERLATSSLCARFLDSRYAAAMAKARRPRHQLDRPATINMPMQRLEDEHIRGRPYGGTVTLYRG